MAIEKMLLLNMTFDKSELQKVLFHFKDSHELYLQNANKVIRKVEDVHDLMIDSRMSGLMSDLEELAIDLKLKLTDEIPYENSVHFANCEKELNHVKEEVKKIKEVRDELVKESNENEKTLELLKHINDTEINLDVITSLNYITVRFGRLKKDKLGSLQYIDKPFIFHSLGEDKEYAWVCYIALNSVILEIDNLFKSLAFEDIQIPDFVHGTIEDGKKELENQLNAMHEYILRMDTKISALRESKKIDLLKMYSTLKYLLNVDNGKQYIVDFKNKYAFYAFVSPRDLDTVLKRFEDVNGLECHQLPSHLLSDQGVEAPKVIHNYFWVRPFEFMIHIKENDEYDPTMLTAILFYAVSLLFIGDIGLGCLLLILGFIMKKEVGRLFKALSIPLIIGGLIYGSVFYTNIYTSLINVSALNRVIDGIVVLVCGYYTIQTIKEMCTSKPMIEKLLSLKGVCGIVALYTFIIYLIAIYKVHLNISLIPFTIVLIACFLLVMLRTVINKKIQ